MFKTSAAKAFGRGLSYHAGAGIGEAIRGVTTLGATALVVLGIQNLSTRLEHRQLQKDLNNILKK